MDLESYCDRLAKLAVEIGANIQEDQIVAVTYAPGMEPLVYAIARTAYERGARFVDPFVFDGRIKRIRLETARQDTLEFVPEWWGHRALQLGENQAARISIAPNPDPGVLDGVDPERAGKDDLPFVKETVKLIKDRSTNWTIVPFPTPGWAAKLHPDLGPDEALAQLTDQLAHILRLEQQDPAAAWRARGDELVAVADRLSERGFDALQFRGPGTDLKVGLFPGSTWTAARLKTAWGLEHYANLPSEETFTTPDPRRTEGTVTATKPLDVSGTVIDGLRVRFENGRAVEIDADQGADVLRGRAGKDEGASRLGEVALVDKAGRIAESGSVFFNTLLDENAASHIALGNGYRDAVDQSHWDEINDSQIHIDFMIGSPEVDVFGLDGDGGETPVLVDGGWQI
ncbi:MAG TPA: aminopeptidase [Thermoleophilaceae bacterium]|nr:aminopeptidase [Thermoleophilaceae bacterium]